MLAQLLHPAAVLAACWLTPTDRFAELLDVEQISTPQPIGSILPFPPTPSASVAGPTIQESTDDLAEGTASGSSTARRTS